MKEPAQFSQMAERDGNLTRYATSPFLLESEKMSFGTSIEDKRRANLRNF
jgi:hypothetical protein